MRELASTLVLATMLAATACSSATPAPAPSTHAPKSAPVVQAPDPAVHAPEDDVKITACETDETLQIPTAKLRVTNHSSKSSNYIVQVEFLDKMGTRVADGYAATNSLGSGKTALADAMGSAQVKSRVACRVAEVTRYAAH